MSGGKFDETLQLNGGYPLPAGPLELDKDEKALRLDVWVFQGDAACVTVLDNPSSDTWEARPAPEDYTGKKFHPGPATGMALLLSTTGLDKYEVYQWTMGVQLA
jgi:hypothetical protein